MLYENSSTQVSALVCMAVSMKEGVRNPFSRALVTLVMASLTNVKLCMMERSYARMSVRVIEEDMLLLLFFRRTFSTTYKVQSLLLEEHDGMARNICFMDLKYVLCVRLLFKIWMLVGYVVKYLTKVMKTVVEKN